jgi:hypothetical protein
MVNLSNMTKQRTIYLVSELVIIVIGVLMALAFDEWRGNLDLEERKRHILTSLVIDLKEDRFDFNDFITSSRKRAEAARFLMEYSKTDYRDSAAWTEGPGEAFFQLAITSRMQPTRSAFDEMNATGTAMVIDDTNLRSEIAKYYSEAEDRTAINDLITPDIQRFRHALEGMGVSYSDRETIDADIVLQNSSLLAIIRSLGDMASFAPRYCEGLIIMNQTLIEKLELRLTESQ